MDENAMPAGGGALVVDPGALRAGQSQADRLADALTAKLRQTGTDVNELLETWHGAAAVKWSDGWNEVHESAMALCNILGALSDALGEAASQYEEQEAENQSELAKVQQKIQMNF